MSDTVQQQSPREAAVPGRKEGLAAYLLLGIALGFVFTRTEVISWWRIQEMFRFQSFHMYGVIGSAVAVGALGLWLARRLEGGTPKQPRSQWDPEKPGIHHALGGTAFGLGWGLLGACPGPIYVLIGNGLTVMVVALASAVAGVWTYGLLRDRLPHA